jgi:hypothetical protein
MSLQKFRNSPAAPDFDEAADYDFGSVVDPEYDEAPQLGYGEGVDPDYDQDVADPDAGEAPSQEWYLRKQK